MFNCFTVMDLIEKEHLLEISKPKTRANRRLFRGQSEGQYLRDGCTIKGSDGLITAASRFSMANIDSWEAFEDAFCQG